MKNEEVKKEKVEKTKETLGDIWKKTQDISKKVAKKAQDEAKKLSEQMEQKKQEREQEKYNPLTEKEFRSKKFNVPNIIMIVDEAPRRDVQTCAGAIGWRQMHKDVEVLYIYDEFVSKCGLTFVPTQQVNNVYCVDNFDRSKFINVNYIFGKVTEEKIAELEHVAYCLGAKNCSVEIVETDSNKNSSSVNVEIKIPKISTNTSSGRSFESLSKQSGKTVTKFEGARDPIKPTLKWFAHDDNITRLIEMRCSDSNAIKSKVLELKGSTSTAMSQMTAIAVDNVLGKKLKGGISAESQVSKEQSRVLIFEVEF